ncbi:hypothetical protein FG386_001628 [Cryptosporidium ryanae]|uniref:uncharacterized protein n=1 Tax=Cryptosporidium ryanae TaxID=515981 RepID=UPI00351A9E39|nr:hypothetical protein FG386_001628 [Cryptosporidium ryanae]
MNNSSNFVHFESNSRSFSDMTRQKLIFSPQTMVIDLFEAKNMDRSRLYPDKNLSVTSLVPYNKNSTSLFDKGLPNRKKNYKNDSGKCELVPQYFNLHCPMCGRLMPQKFLPSHCKIGIPLKKKFREFECSEANEKVSNEYNDYVSNEDLIKQRSISASNVNSDEETSFDIKDENPFCNIENQNHFFFLEELYRQLSIRNNVKRVTFPVLDELDDLFERKDNEGIKNKSFEFITQDLPTEYKEKNNLINLSSDLLMTGYYKKFFIEIKKLGSGSFGQVYLCAHVLDGITLAQYAVKKVPVGDNKKWLSTVLREVKIRELLHHPNIVQYRHSWLELYSSNDHCPKVPWLFQLMEYCNSGSLEVLIQSSDNELLPSPNKNSKPEKDLQINEIEDKKYKAINDFNNAYTKQDTQLPEHEKYSLSVVDRTKKIKLDSLKGKYILDDHIWKIFFDIILGLQHLHHRGILHRDLKPSNILLHVTFDEFLAQPICQALLSDFGTAQILKQRNSGINRSLSFGRASQCFEGQNLYGDAQDEFLSSNKRHGFTGTIEYTAPELLMKDIDGNFVGEYDIYSDIWSLGITLFVLCYNKVPFFVRSSDGFDPEDPDESIRAILSGMNDLQFPNSPPRSQELKLLIKSLLEPDPNRRPNTDDILRHPVIQQKLRSPDLVVNASIELAVITRRLCSGSSSLDPCN